ncbi:MAG: glycoside hydrolase family 28 protein [Prevotellaceae bacterium]|jgi:polygalacturonase|nr:glycoside hydrolase family 28 protein [Prevotellaceae bacterium]
MKTIPLCTSLLLAAGSVCGQVTEEAWRQAAAVEKSIALPTFKAQQYPITKFGAVAGDPARLNHDAINSAITACSAAGGGTVTVPKGVFYTGPITLKSNVNLHLEENAVLKFTTDAKYYFPAVLTRWEGIDCYNAHPLIYAREAENIGITGKGTIDGSASNNDWWAKCGAVRYGYKEGQISQRTGRPKLLTFEQNQVPVEERVMNEEDGLRPQLINLYGCTRVLIENVKLISSPFWVIHPLLCDQLTVRNVTVVSHGPNSDGCDPESCSNVLIEGCTFDTGDDCIAIKSGRNNDGRRWNKPSENIIVRRCKMKDGHGGVVIGSEISGGYRNLYVENCEMDSPELDRVIRIKTSNCRGGIVENVFVRNVKVGQCREAVLKINLIYDQKEQCRREFPPVVRNVHLENITSGKSQYGVLITGLEGLENVYDITVSNSAFNGVEKGNSITGARNVKYSNLYINGKLAEN